MRKLICAVLLLASVSCFAKPAIKFEKTEHDFGKQRQEKKLSYIFKFSNEGTSLLIIDKVTASCGCTGTVLSKKEIAAGKNGEIKVTLNTGHYEGEISKSVLVYSNDPKNSLVRLVLNATVKK